MKRSFWVILWSLCLCMSFSYMRAQSNGNKVSKTSISGRVMDENNVPVPYASVAVYSTEDSIIVTGSTTDLEGKFSIPVPSGLYYMKITFLSYEEKIVSNVQLLEESVALGKVVLQAKRVNIDAVTVTAEKSQMELDLDKRVFNVGKDLANTGRNAAEILDNVPSVTVDVEGNVSLRGSGNVRILIDGKPSGLVGISSTDALRQLQGNMVESIEVITNPSARYDAEGEVGIVNIILKKEKREGLNGSFELSVGQPDNYVASFSLNQRKKWANLFTSYGVNYRKTPGRGYSIQEFTGDTVFSYERERTHERGGLSHNLRLGTDIYLNEWNTITVAGLYKASEGLNEASLFYRDFNDVNELVQTVVRNEEELESQNNIEGSFNYTRKFPEKGRSWTVDFKWIESDDTELADLVEENDNGDAPIFQRSSNTEDERNILIQSDYVHPFAKKGKFETGFRTTLRDIENNYLVELQDDVGNWYTLEDFDNHFIYTENIYAGYMMAGNKIGLFSYQLGLRAEYSDISTRLIKTNEVNDRTYLNFFPSTHFSYELDSSNTLQLSYSRRLSRPRFRDLLPFFSFSDNRNFFSGNPDLNPEYTHSFEIGHLKMPKWGTILSSLYYRYRTGVIERILIADSTGFTRRFPVNLSVQNAFGVEFNVNYEAFKWWRLNANFNFYRAITSGTYEGQDLSSDTYTWTSRGSSRFTLWKKVDLQTTFNYRAPRITTQGKSLAMYSIDIGLSKEILNGNGTLTFSAKDILNSRKRRSLTITDDFYSESSFQWRSRQFLITFNYRLNQTKSRNRGEGSGNFDGGDEGGF